MLTEGVLNPNDCMTHLLIDGYNYVKQSAMAALLDPFDLESGRRYLLDELSRYKKEKKMRITVVFDATQGFSPGRKKEGYRGVEVIYSKQGETADEVMMETIRERQGGPSGGHLRSGHYRRGKKACGPFHHAREVGSGPDRRQTRRRRERQDGEKGQPP